MLELRPRDRKVGRLRARRLQLRLRLRDVDARNDPLVEAVDRELESGLVGRDVRIEQLLLRVQAVEQEVIDGELRLEGEPDRLEIRRARLGRLDVRFDVAADAAENVELPGKIRRHLVLGRRSGRNGARRPRIRAGDRRGRADRRGKVRARSPGRGAGAAKDRLAPSEIVEECAERAGAERALTPPPASRVPGSPNAGRGEESSVSPSPSIGRGGQGVRARLVATHRRDPRLG